MANTTSDKKDYSWVGSATSLLAVVASVSRPSVSATRHPSQPLHLRVARQLIPFAPARPAAEKLHSDLTPLKAWLLRPPGPWLPPAPRLRLRLSMSRHVLWHLGYGSTAFCYRHQHRDRRRSAGETGQRPAGPCIGGYGVLLSLHRHPGPLLLSVAAAALLLWVFYSSYSKPLELTGFAALVAASVWDFRAKKRAGSVKCNG